MPAPTIECPDSRHVPAWYKGQVLNAAGMPFACETPCDTSVSAPVENSLTSSTAERSCCHMPYAVSCTLRETVEMLLCSVGECSLDGEVSSVPVNSFKTQRSECIPKENCGCARGHAQLGSCSDTVQLTTASANSLLRRPAIWRASTACLHQVSTASDGSTFSIRGRLSVIVFSKAEKAFFIEAQHCFILPAQSTSFIGTFASPAQGTLARQYGCRPSEAGFWLLAAADSRSHSPGSPESEATREVQPTREQVRCRRQHRHVVERWLCQERTAEIFA